MTDPITRIQSPARRHRAAPQLPPGSSAAVAAASNAEARASAAATATSSPPAVGSGAATRSASRPHSPAVRGVGPGASSSPSPSAAPASLFHDPAIDEFCRLEVFQGAYSTRTVMAGLSERLIQRSKADPGPFNPKPFIRTFESAVDSLLQLRSSLTSQENQLASSVQVSESAYSSKLHSLSSAFGSVATSFASLESRFSDVGRTALQIGEQLETIDRLRTRAAEASDLIEYYYQFARGDTTRLDRLRKEGGRQGRLRTAVIARRMAAIAREVDMPGADKTRETIDAFSERFERDMLKLFDKFYRKSDPKMMSHIAKVLQAFNGGHSCVQIYVNQHDFFISKDRQQMSDVREDAEGIWASLPNPDALPPKSEESLASLFAEIRSTVEIEAQIISAVFPSPMLVMSTFLQRVFAQSVQAHVERIMERAAAIGAQAQARQEQLQQPQPPATTDGHSQRQQPLPPPPQPPPPAGPDSNHSLAFLRMLHLARSMALSLVNDLKQYDFRGAGIVGPGAAGLRVNGIDGLGGGGSDSVGVAAAGASGGANGAALHEGGAGSGGVSSLGSLLDQAVEELFVPYMEGVRYLDRETRNLADLYSAFLMPFANAHRATQEVKSATIFDRVRAQVSAASSTTASLASGASAAASSMTSAASSMATAAPGGVKGSSFGFSKLTGLVDRARAAAALPASTSSAGGSEVGSESAATTSTEGASTATTTGSSHATTVVGDGSGGLGTSDAEGASAADLTLDAAERMLRWHAEAVGRCVDLSSPGDVAKHALALLKALSETLIKSYIEVALESALSLCTSQESSSRSSANLPELSPLGVVRRADLILQLWQHYVQTALLPLAASSVTVRREVAVFNNHNLLRVEAKCDAVVQKVTDNLIAFLAGRLATQKKNDFSPKNDDVAFSRMNTDPCVACVDALRRVHEAARDPNRGLGGGREADAFLTEVGTAFHGLLLEHLKKYTVSAAGGIVLGQDLSSYQDAVSSWGLPQVTERFDMLRQLGNLFILPPRVLQGFMREGHLAKIEPRLLRPYLLRRADYAKEVRDLDDSPLYSASTGSTTTAAERTRTPGSSSLAAAAPHDEVGHPAGEAQGLASMQPISALGAGPAKLEDILRGLEAGTAPTTTPARA